MATTVITITHGSTEAAADVAARMYKAGNPAITANLLQNSINALASGARNGSMDIQVDGGDGVAASGTVTFTGGNTANDTLVINGTTLTAVASGATGNQWNTAANASLQAVQVATKINASATSLVSGHVTATSVSTVTVAFATTAEADDVIDINGVEYLAVASGADITANEFNIGVSATASAANLAITVNRNLTTMALLASAIAATGTLTLISKADTALTVADTTDGGSDITVTHSAVLTLTAKVKGVSGNAITIAEGVDAGSKMSVSAARLASGAAAAANSFAFGA